MVIANRGVRKTIIEKIFWFKGTEITEDIKIPVTILSSYEDSENIKYHSMPTLSEFDFTSLVANPSIMIYNDKQSNLAKELVHYLYTHNKISAGIIITPHKKISGKYSGLFSDDVIYNKLDDELIERILNRQCRILEHNRKLEIKNNSNLVVVLENCLVSDMSSGVDRICLTPKLAELMFNGRHYNITLIIDTVVPLHLAPELRSNIDYFFLFNDDNINNMKKIYDMYAGMFPTVETFIKLSNMTALTANRSMVIINRGVTRSMFDKVKHYTQKMSTFSLPQTINNIDMIESPIIKKIDDTPIMNDQLSCIESEDFDFAESVSNYKKLDMCDKTDSLLLGISECNNNITKLMVNDSDLNDVRLDIFNNITSCNKLIANFLTKKN